MNDDEDIPGLLRRSDPAASLPPLRPDRIHDLTEHAMDDTTTRTAATARTRERPVSIRRRVVVGAVALGGLAAAAAIAVPIALGSGAAPTALRQPPAVDGLSVACAPVDAGFVREAEVAFRGEVTGIDGGTATLRVLDRYAGEVADTVTVAQGTGSGVDGESPVLLDGRTYLVAATDGTVLGCGTTGTDSPALRAVYDEAFGG